MDGVSVRDGRRRASGNQPNGRATDHVTRGLRAASPPDDPPVAVRSLRWILLTLDVGAVTLAWLITLLVPGEFTRFAERQPARASLIELVRDHGVVGARDRVPAPLPRTGVRGARGRDGSARHALLCSPA